MVKQHIRTGLAVLGVVALPVGFMTVAAQADEPTQTVTIREADLLPAPIRDTRAQGDIEFLREGIVVETGDNTSTTSTPNNKAAEYWAAEGGLPASGSYVWRGTSAQPGTQVVFDTDGDRTNANSFNVLVGEEVYSANARDGELTDWWYTGGRDRAAARGIACPTTTDGSGSNCHGTLEDWQEALPDAEVYAYGFSLGSGVKGQGLLRNVTFGDTRYEFTSDAEEVTEEPTTDPTDDPTTDPTDDPTTDPSDDPTDEPTDEPTTGPTRQPTRQPTTGPTTTPPTTEPTDEPTDDPTTEPAPRRVDVRGSVTAQRDGRTLDIQMTSRNQPSNSEVGDKLRWRITVVGEGGAIFTQGFDEVDTWTRTFRDDTGRYTVRVFKNGKLVREYTIRTGR